MNNNNKKGFAIIAIVAVLFFGLIFGIVSLIGNSGKSDEGEDMPSHGSDVETLSDEEAAARLDKYVGVIKPRTVQAEKVPVELGKTDVAAELPDIDTNKITVQGNGAINIEIFSTAEKAGNGNDGWLNQVAEKFNAAGNEYNGKSISITVRTIAAGQAVDYITSGKYLPQAFTPSNELMGEMIISQNVKCEMYNKSLVRNAAGMVLSEDVYNQIMKKYDAVNVKTVAQATADSVIAMGYTNPFASSTGLNFLISLLYTYDSNNILSDTAKAGFNSFQANVPFVAYTTLQMRDAVSSGSLNGLVLEHQTFVNTSGLEGYKFIPFGVRHDNPLYGIGDLNDEQKYALKLFSDYCSEQTNQELAIKCGFNNADMDKYQSEIADVDGTKIVSAQKLWKENKDVSKPIAAVFVADTSGSMYGEPLNQLKSSLVNASSYINSTNSIGLVSYGNNVNINLPIAPFDLNQRSYFAGAVQSLSADGATATYDAVMVALDMLLKYKEANPNVKPVIFLLSDGEQNSGYEFEDIEGILKHYGIVVYSIGYNANIDELSKISSLNEGTVINADSDDVIYKLKNLFNAQM